MHHPRWDRLASVSGKVTHTLETPHGSWWMSNDSMDWGRETAPQHALTLLDNNINLNRNGAHEGDLAWQRDVWRLGGAFVGATRDDHTTNLRA